MTIKPLLRKIPLGYSEGMYQGKRYALTRRDFNAGRSSKVFARELGGNDFISFNFYETTTETHFKPCEMPAEKVRDFLVGVEVDLG